MYKKKARDKMIYKVLTNLPKEEFRYILGYTDEPKRCAEYYRKNGFKKGKLFFQPMAIKEKDIIL
jgi:hypothetical protein